MCLFFVWQLPNQRQQFFQFLRLQYYLIHVLLLLGWFHFKSQVWRQFQWGDDPPVKSYKWFRFISKLIANVYNYLSSPTMINGSFWLKLIRVRRTVLRATTCWMQIALYLFTFRSNTKTFPSEVTAAKTVLENGAHLTSPTLAPKSKTNNGSL